MAGVNDIAGSGSQCVAPCESCLRARLHSDDGVGLGGGVWSAVADDIVGGNIGDRLDHVSHHARMMWRRNGDVHHRMRERGHRRLQRRCSGRRRWCVHLPMMPQQQREGI